MTVVTDMQLAAPIRGSRGDAAVMASDFEMKIGDQQIRTSAIDVMEFDEGGKIQRMRAYWGPSDTHRQEPTHG